MKGVHYNINELKDRSGEYHVYPKGGETSYRTTFVALANALYFGQAEDEEAELVDSCLAKIQQKFISGWEELSARIASEKIPGKREEIMTAEHMQMSEEAHRLALALYRHMVYKEPLSGAGTD